MTVYAAIDGQRASRVSLHVPTIGPWWTDVELEGAPDLSGRVTLALGELELSGTIAPDHNGVEAGVRRLRIVAGAGGWSSLVAARAYHNDAGVRAQTVASDVASLAGEQLGDFVPAAERIGADYVRQSGPAARVLEDVIGAVSWWVDFDGRTQVGTRPESTPEPGAYEVLEVTPDERMVTLAVDDLSAVAIGSVLTERLEAPQTVRELEIQCTPDSVRLRAWCGGSTHTRSRLVRAFANLVGRVNDRKLLGVFRYRVVRMSSDRVELQAVRRDIGLPDVSPVSMWPGVAGAHAELAPGAEVLLEFIEGDRTMPIIRGFAGKGGPGHEPTELVLSATAAASALKLGGPGASHEVAWRAELHAELVKIQTTLETGANSGGDVVFATPYSAPSLSSLGSSKVVTE